MTEKAWETLVEKCCQHVDQKVGLQAQVAYSPEHLPDQPPRVFAHRCTHGFTCNLDGRPSCIWAGTNPTFDPFKE